MEGNLRFKIDWASLIVGSKFTVFAFFYFVFEGNFLSTGPRGLIFGGAILFFYYIIFKIIGSLIVNANTQKTPNNFAGTNPCR